MGLREVFAVGSLFLEQVGHRVEPESIDAPPCPESGHIKDRLLNRRVLIVEIRLMGKEPMPEELLTYRIERPVAFLGIDEDDAGIAILEIVILPHVEIAVRPRGIGSRGLKPRVLIRRVVDNQINDDADPALVGGLDELLELLERAVFGINRREIGDIVASVTHRRRVERRDP